MKTKLAEPQRQAELDRLTALPDERIDTVDIPEASAVGWDEARRGHYRPVKQPVTLRLDADVVGWFKARALGRGYQTEINRVLRQYVTASRNG